MARIWVLSDLHLEFAPFDPVPPEADFLVAAGDISVGLKGIDFLRRFAPTPVIYVAGNHEYYGESIPRLTHELRDKCAGTNVHFLENESIELAGVRILGCTLWTDFALFGPEKRPQAMETARAQMTDYRRIRLSPTFRKFSPLDAYQIHCHSRRWLNTELAQQDKKCVVVTHHAPHRDCLNPQHGPDLLSTAFASDCSEELKSGKIACWISGHTHYSLDSLIGNTRVVSNQRCYPSESLENFDPRLVIEV